MHARQTETGSMLTQGLAPEKVHLERASLGEAHSETNRASLLKIQTCHRIRCLIVALAIGATPHVDEFVYSF